MTLTDQRWVRPLDVAPGHWKKQLPTKRLKIAARGDVAGLRALLAGEPESLNRRSSHGRTLLWEAVRAGQGAAVRFLIKAGADVNLTGCYNSESHVQLTPCCAAVYYSRHDLVSYLQKRCEPPDIFRQTFLGEGEGVMARLNADPALLGAEDPHDEIYFMPLLAFAVAGGQLDLARDLIARGASVTRYSALLLFLTAKGDGHGDLLTLVLAGGADADQGETALIATKSIKMFQHLLSARSAAAAAPALHPILRADRAERPDKVATLLDHGGAIDQPDENGRTALHLACRARQLRVIALLLARGADPTLTDGQGQTARELAQAANCPEAVALLAGR